MDALLEKIGSFTKAISLLAVVSLISGFLVWNFYLSNFGFSEFNIIQSRFILSGFSFLVFFAVIIFIFLIIVEVAQKMFPKFELSPTKLKFIFVVLYLVFVPIYAKRLFPYIPNYLGGGKPIVLSIIADQTEISLLEPFLGSLSPVQSGNQCVVYENQDIFIVLLSNRIVELKKSGIQGFNRVPSQQAEEADIMCSNIANAWINNKPTN